VFIAIPLHLAFALLVALILNRQSKMVPLYRVVYYLPSILGGSVAVSVMWRYCFSKTGVLNTALQAIGIASNISWISNKDTALWSLILLFIWQFGSPMLIFLSGLKQIPKSYYEAAECDGAGPLVRFFRITLPLLTPIIFFNLVMQMIGGFMVFSQAMIITDGGPMNRTLVYALYLYRQSFAYYKMGYGCAMAWVLMTIIGFFTLLVFRSSSAWVFYENEIK
jgi:multiple sugar transport system permease protein